MLAERADEGEFVDPEEIDVGGVGIDDVTYLSASGVDTDAVSAAAERAEAGGSSTRSRKQVVLDGLADIEAPTEDDVIEYAAGAGVSEPYVERTLRKLRQSGEVTRTNGVYRLL